MFVIVEAAVYRHRVMGVAEQLDDAIELARQAAHTERNPHPGPSPDGHHRYEILAVPVGHLVDDGADHGYVAFVVDPDRDGTWRTTIGDLCYWSSRTRTRRHRPDRILHTDHNPTPRSPAPPREPQMPSLPTPPTATRVVR